MVTPLFWKSWDLSNEFYSRTLRYCFFAKMDTKKQFIVIEKRQTKLIPLYSCICAIVLLFLLFIFVLFLELHFHKILVDQSKIMLYICLLAIVALTLALFFCICPIVDTASQFYNRLMHYEMTLFRSKHVCNSSWKRLIKEGIRSINYKL